MLVGQSFGPFSIDKELGSGAMGTVYRGRYTKSGQIMAIKVMAPSIGSTNAAALDRFEREITILKQLSHSNIVRFYGAGKHQKMRYFAMEYVEGESLDKVMLRRGRMTWEEVVKLGQQLCAALQHAHEKGIIHRDLKPSNIMVLSDGTLKLTDFGIAKDMDLEGLTATNCTVGTASYMSPEQCKGNTNLTPKSDLYSLGVLLYELLTGQKPFKAETAMEMFLQHVQGTFERPSRVVLDIPIWLDTLICQLLEKKPEQRPLDAAMVGNTLGTIREKVEAQQSAGVDAVRRRFIDRAPGKKKPDEEDKEAARILLTGKGKAKRKQTKKPLHEQVWLRAVGLLFLLGVAGTLLYLVFRPPPADKLYQQAKKVWQAGNFEEKEAAIEPDGAIAKYLYHYEKRHDEQAKEVRSWQDQIEETQCDRLLENYMRKERGRSPIKVAAQYEYEREAFAAVKAEEDGEPKRALDHWQKVNQIGPEKWQRVASRHLKDLDLVLKELDKEFQQIHERILRDSEEPTFTEQRKAQAFHAWRAEHSEVGSSSLAKSLFEKLLKETKEDSGLQNRWFIYAKWNYDRLKGDDDKGAVKEKLRRKIDDMEKKISEQAIAPGAVKFVYLDILALYGNDEDMKALVERAKEVRDKLVRRLRS